MNKWLVGVGLVGVSLVIIGHYIPWVTLYTETGGATSIIDYLYGRIFGAPILMLGLFVMFCIFGAAIIPTGRSFTSIATKIIGVFVATCGVIIIIGATDAFLDLRTLTGIFTTVRYGYGFEFSLVGGIFILLAGIFGMFTTEPSTKTFIKS